MVKSGSVQACSGLLCQGMKLISALGQDTVKIAQGCGELQKVKEKDYRLV